MTGLAMAHVRRGFFIAIAALFASMPLPVLAQPDPNGDATAPAAPDAASAEAKASLPPGSLLPLLDDSFGIFAREGADTRIELFPCEDEELCGRIVWLRRMAEADGSKRRDLKNPDEDLRDRALIGMTVLWDLEARKNDDRWTGGRIYNPDDGKDYRAKVRFMDDDTVELKACVLIICETQIWTRVQNGTDTAPYAVQDQMPPPDPSPQDGAE